MGAEIFALGYLAKKALDRIEDAFTDKVINRWSGFRARRFLRTFAQAVTREAQDKGGEERVNTLLDELLSSETKTEVLFEAYRRVVLSASKELGPRIIALLTAQLVSLNRFATDDEEMILRAAESFTDRELQSFKARLPNPTDPHDVTEEGGLKYTLDTKTINVSTTVPRIPPHSVPIGSMNLIQALGSWAPKAIQFGLLREEIVENIPRRSRYIDDDGYEREIQWSVVYAPASKRLVELIERAEASLLADSQ